MQDKYIRATFTNYISKVIKNTAIDYFQKEKKKQEKIISIYTINECICMSQNTDSTGVLFFEEKLEEDYSNLEIIFQEEKYYKAMKQLKTIQKQVLYYSILAKYSAEQISKILNITIDNVYQIKKRAIEKFISNMKGEWVWKMMFL